METQEEKSVLWRLLDAKLKAGLDQYVSSHRQNGRGWEWIAQDLLMITGVRTTDETLRRWYGEKP